MKNVIRAIVIIAVVMAVYKNPLPTWLQGQLSDGATTVPKPGKASSAFGDDVFAFDGNVLASADEAQMLAVFEQGYQPPGDCDTSASAKARCKGHLQSRLDEFRRQWSAYYQR